MQWQKQKNDSTVKATEGNDVMAKAKKDDTTKGSNAVTKAKKDNSAVEATGGNDVTAKAKKKTLMLKDQDDILLVFPFDGCESD
jgi:hypothetical protein